MVFWKKLSLFFKLLINSDISETRQAWRAGIVSVAALLLNKFWLQTEFPLWILLTSIVCLQTNFGATLRKSRQRIVGTILGCAVAFLISYLFPGRYVLFVIIILLTIIFWYLNSIRSYTYTVFFMTLAVMMLYFSLYTNGPYFVFLRIEDVACGAILGSLSLLLIWPEFAGKNFMRDLDDVNTQINNFFLVFIDWLQDKQSANKVYKQKIVSSTSLQTARTRMSEISYELGIQLVGNRIGEIFHRHEIAHFPLKEYEQLLTSETRIHYALLTLFNALLLESYENRKENFSFYKEKLDFLHKHFKEIAQKVYLGSKNGRILLMDNQKIENTRNTDFFEEKTVSEESLTDIKLFSFFNKVFEEIELMEKAVKKLELTLRVY